MRGGTIRRYQLAELCLVPEVHARFVFYVDLWAAIPKEASDALDVAVFLRFGDIRFIEVDEIEVAQPMLRPKAEQTVPYGLGDRPLPASNRATRSRASC